MQNDHKFFQTPPYTWPNPDIFPFRSYFTSDRMRIFLIDCVLHNWMWLSKYHDRIRPTDVFIVFSTWWGVPLADNTKELFDALGIPKSQFVMLCNSQDEIDAFSQIGLQTVLINNNAFLDSTLHPGILPDVEKQFDAIYVGRRSDWKRHILASKVPNLAIVAGHNHGNNIAPIPDTTVYINDAPLDVNGVFEKINQSYCGLILSETEGACYASSEYLLCGIPVVSTHSNGGRDIWYDDYNAIICDPDEEAIADAVAYFRKNPRDPHRIRQTHIEKAQQFRRAFIDLLGDIFDRHGVQGVDSEAYFLENYFHKMRKSERVEMGTLFGRAA